MTAPTLVGPDPSAPVERVWLDRTSWLDVLRGWAVGDRVLYGLTAGRTSLHGGGPDGPGDR